jgi:DNA mismatch repair protein MutL
MEGKRIFQLPSLLANQIAAGEVIERPASVLKELLENSLDANSTEIDITIEKGGIGLIRVQDNGAGICKEDLALAVAPHATSKIQTLSDLENVMSYGFRGEALASISSVSKLELISWREDQEFSWNLLIAGRNQAPTLMPAPKRKGSLVAVRDLFYNTPARRKFLRSEKTELLYVEEVFKRVALSQPGVSFKYQQGDRLQKRLPVCKDFSAHAKRVANLCGQQFIENAYFVQAEVNGLKLSGWLGTPGVMRSQADLQYFYVNGRIVRDKVVMHAIRQAYQEILIPGRYPAYVLYFELDPTAIDVNVHPTKHEVRFREARTVHAFLTYAIQTGLKQGGGNTPVDLALPFLDNLSEKSDRYDGVTSEKVGGMPMSFGEPLYLVQDELLLLAHPAGLNVFDMKAARKFSLQQHFSSAYQAEGMSKRALVMPISMILEKVVELLESTSIGWEKLGFELSAIGENVLLVRAVPVVFGAKTEYLEIFLAKLLRSQTIAESIDYLVEHVMATEALSMEISKQLLDDLSALEISTDKNIARRFYKQLTLADLRAALGL